jgi:hypothetical protein
MKQQVSASVLKDKKWHLKEKFLKNFGSKSEEKYENIT